MSNPPLERERLLEEWPYATRRLLEGPDPRLIEAHACAHFCRLLRTGRITAFIGSGVSMA